MTARARAKRAAELTIGDKFDRCFDDCFENGDGALVCRHFWGMYDQSARLRAAVARNVRHFSADGTIDGIESYRKHQLSLGGAEESLTLYDAEEPAAETREIFLTREERLTRKAARELAEMMSN